MTSSFYNYLIQEKSLDRTTLSNAKETSSNECFSTFDILIKKGLIPEKELLKSASQFFNIPFEKMSDKLFDKIMKHEITESMARHHNVIPLFKIENTLTLGVNTPFNTNSIDEIENLTGLKVNLVLLTQHDILEGLIKLYSSSNKTNYAYTKEDTIHKFLEECIPINQQIIDNKLSLLSGIHHNAVQRVYDSIIDQSLDSSTELILIEIHQKSSTIRIKRKSKYITLAEYPNSLSNLLFSKFKYEANLDFTPLIQPIEKTVTKLNNNNKIELSFLFSVTNHGEKLSIKPHSHSTKILPFNQLELSTEQKRAIIETLNLTTGINIVFSEEKLLAKHVLYSILDNYDYKNKHVISLQAAPVIDVNQISLYTISKHNSIEQLFDLSLTQTPDLILSDKIPLLTLKDPLKNDATLPTIFFINNSRNLDELNRKIHQTLEPGLLPDINTIIYAKPFNKICQFCKTKNSEISLNHKKLLKKYKIDFTKHDFYLAKGCEACNGNGSSEKSILNYVLEKNDCQTILEKQKKVKQNIHEKNILNDLLDKSNKGLISIEELINVCCTPKSN